MSSAEQGGRHEYQPDDYDTPIQGSDLTLRDLNELVIEHSTEIRIVNGVETTIVHRRPIVIEPPTPEILDLAERLTPDPADVARIKAEVDRLARKAYEEQRRYLQGLENSTGHPNPTED